MNFWGWQWYGSKPSSKESFALWRCERIFANSAEAASLGAVSIRASTIGPAFLAFKTSSSNWQLPLLPWSTIAIQCVQSLHYLCRVHGFPSAVLPFQCSFLPVPQTFKLWLRPKRDASFEHDLKAITFKFTVPRLIHCFFVASWNISATESYSSLQPHDEKRTRHSAATKRRRRWVALENKCPITLYSNLSERKLSSLCQQRLTSTMQQSKQRDRYLFTKNPPRQRKERSLPAKCTEIHLESLGDPLPWELFRARPLLAIMTISERNFFPSFFRVFPSFFGVFSEFLSLPSIRAKILHRI